MPTDETVTVYLVRHGETAWNAERRFQGYLDVPLSERGKCQAEAAAAWFGEQPARFAAIYSSDLRRARETAETIGQALGLVPRSVPALREIDVGTWSGLSRDEIEDRYPGQLRKWDDAVHTFRLPQGESVAEVQHRAMAAFTEIAERHASEPIVLVAHGVVLAALLAALQGHDLAEGWPGVGGVMSNTGVTVVHWHAGRRECRMEVFDSQEHLQRTDRPTSESAP